mmetsp:Transcript_16728/g.32720  ORF Transcript_16728/g.32720 Transcript_16728/m.32720 type:complete len:86 (+) Transcript_16728:87-344(+)
MQFHVTIWPQCDKTSAHDDECNDVHTCRAATRVHARIHQKVVSMQGETGELVAAPSSSMPANLFVNQTAYPCFSEHACRSYFICS